MELPFDRGGGLGFAGCSDAVSYVLSCLADANLFWQGGPPIVISSYLFEIVRYSQWHNGESWFLYIRIYYVDTYEGAYFTLCIFDRYSWKTRTALKWCGGGC